MSIQRKACCNPCGKLKSFRWTVVKKLTVCMSAQKLCRSVCEIKPGVNQTPQSPCLKGLWPNTLHVSASLRHVSHTPAVSISLKHVDKTPTVSISPHTTKTPRTKQD